MTVASNLLLHKHITDNNNSGLFLSVLKILEQINYKYLE